MNIIDLQERLKDFPEQALMQEMQAPSGMAPQFLVLSELKRRKRMRDDFQRAQAADMKTVAEEAITGAGVPQAGIMQMAGAMAPNTNVAQDTGINDAMERTPTQAPQPQGIMSMARGGYVKKMQEGRLVGAPQTVVVDGRQYLVSPDGSVTSALGEPVSFAEAERAKVAASGQPVLGGMGDVSTDLADFDATQELPLGEGDAARLLEGIGVGEPADIPVDQPLRRRRVQGIPPDATGVGGFLADIAEAVQNPAGGDLGPRRGSRTEITEPVTEVDLGEITVSPEPETPISMPFGDLSALTAETPAAPAPTAPTAPDGGGGAGGAGGVGGFGPIESRIAQMLQEREQSAAADKWMALAQTGLALMASRQPTLGGAIGEAGLAGIGAMRQARSQYDKDVLGLLEMQAGIQRAKASGARTAAPKATSPSEINAALDYLSGVADQQATVVSVNELGQEVTTKDYSRVSPAVASQIKQLEDQYMALLRGGSVDLNLVQ